MRDPKGAPAPVDLSAALAATLGPIVEAAVRKALTEAERSPWLDRERAAEYLGVTTRTLDTIRKGADAPKEGRAGDSPRWRREDLDAYLEPGEGRVMVHRDTEIVYARKRNKCERCSDPIETGMMIVFYKATRTVAHAACDLRARRRRS